MDMPDRHGLVVLIDDQNLSLHIDQTFQICAKQDDGREVIYRMITLFGPFLCTLTAPRLIKLKILPFCFPFQYTVPRRLKTCLA